MFYDIHEWTFISYFHQIMKRTLQNLMKILKKLFFCRSWRDKHQNRINVFDIIFIDFLLRNSISRSKRWGHELNNNNNNKYLYIVFLWSNSQRKEINIVLINNEMLNTILYMKYWWIFGVLSDWVVIIVAIYQWGTPSF